MLARAARSLAHTTPATHLPAPPTCRAGAGQWSAGPNDRRGSGHRTLGQLAKAAASTEQSGQQPGVGGGNGAASAVQLAGWRPPGGGAGRPPGGRLSGRWLAGGGHAASTTAPACWLMSGSGRCSGRCACSRGGLPAGGGGCRRRSWQLPVQQQPPIHPSNKQPARPAAATG